MHRRTKTVTILAVAILLFAPSATAAWYFAGSYEPSTRYDTADWMWQDAPPAGASRIYFAVFSQYLAAVNPADANPNVGALHTDLEISNAEHHEGILGVWKDCNGDGYIGLGENGAREYPAVLLSSTAICPNTDGPAAAWTPGAHSYNGWVSELVMISRDAAVAADRRLYQDDEARVWGDHHRPEELAAYMRQCPVGPQPVGTYQSTGGLLNFIDCRADVLGATNVALGTIGDPFGWTFSDTDDARSGALGQRSTLGSENDAERAITVWDCRSGTRVGDVLNSTPLGPLPTTGTTAVHNRVVYDIDPSVDDTSAPNERVAGTVNHTVEGTENCNTADDDGRDVYANNFVFYVGEDDRAVANPKNKTVANWNLGFTTSARGALPWSAAIPLRWNGASGPYGGADLLGWEGSRWSGDSIWSSKPGFGTIRTNLQELDNSDVEIADGYWLSFYASVGQATRDRGFQLPSNAVGTYGSAQCGANGSGIHYGWNCDTSLWNRNPDGTPIEPGAATDLEFHEMVVPGQQYQLRDVDCYDGGIGGPDEGSDPIVGIQPAYYGPRPCHGS